MSNVQPFQLLIKPVGADCNLRCEYCFYLRASELYPDHKRHIMSDEMLEHVISGLLSYRFPQSVFAWQGGEPTLAGVDFFQKAVELQKKHGLPGQVVGNAFQTNGVLINEDWCRLFRDYRWLVGLSLDGPREIHDRLRHDKAGRGSWDKVMRAARLMTQYNIEYNILCVLNSVNVHLGIDLVRWFVDQGFNYLQFIPCVEPGNPYTVPAEAYGEFLCTAFDYWAKEGFGRVSIRDFDSLLASRSGEAPLCTYDARCNHYLVIEHNGNVYPCDFFVYDHWKLGNVMDQPLHTFTEHALYRQFAYQKDKVPACRKCQWRPYCHGGCQKDRLYDGTLSDPSYLCPAYKRFFSHAMPRINTLVKKVAAQR
jgi:uncharacterized protein